MTSKTRLALVLIVPALAGLALWFLWGGSSGDAPGAPSAGPTSEASGDALAGDPGPVGDALPSDSGERASDAAPESTPAPTGPPPTGLRVLVTDREGTPLAGVGLRAHPLDRFRDHSQDCDGRTGEDGVATLLDLEPGRTRLTCSLGDRIEAEVIDGEVAELTLVQRSAVQVTGRVVDPAGRGVPGARVYSRSTGHDWHTVRILTITDSNGRFGEVWSNDRQRLFAVATNHGPSAQVEVRARSREDPTATLELVLGPLGGDLSGVVRSELGEPLRDVLLVQEEHAWRSSGAPRRTTRTDEEGRYEFLGLPPGAHSLHATSDDHGRRSWEVEVSAGSRMQRDLVLPPATLVQGQVRLPGGAPAVGAEILVLEHPERPVDVVRGPWVYGLRGPWPVARADSEGLYELRGVEPGVRHLYASLGSWSASIVDATDPRPEFVGVARTVLDLAPGAEVTWSPVLEHGGRLFGRVIDAQGQPLEGTVTLSSSSGRVGFRNLDDDGGFRFEGLSDRDYELRADSYEGFSGFQDPPLQVFSVRPSDRARILHLDGPQPTPTQPGIVRFEWKDHAPEVQEKQLGFDRAERNLGSRRYTAPNATEIELPPGSWVPVAHQGDTLIFEGEPFEVLGGETLDLGPLDVHAPARAIVEVVTPENHTGSIEVRHEPRHRWSQGIALPQGTRRWEFPVLPSGRVTLSASSPGLPTVRTSVELPPGGAGEVRLVLRAGATVRLVLDAEPRRTGHVLDGMLLDESGVIHRTWYRTHGLETPWGQPLEELLAPGNYELRARTDDGQSGTTKFTVGVGPDGEPVAPEGVVEVIAR